jgi:ribose/xylose/arabinose/galactoside ABC-type transport system permease subunit
MAASPVRSPLARSMLLLLAAYIVLCIFLGFTAPNFLTQINIVNILRQASMVGIIGIGMTMVIVAAEIDLSVGALAALCGVILAYLAVTWEWPLYIAIPVVILIGMASGAFIAAFRLLFSIPSFITSLALLTALRSTAFLITKGYPIAPMPPGFTMFANGYIGPVPYLVVIMAVLYLIGWLAMTQTAWGRSIYAVGGNEEAARLSGISVGWVKLSVFMVNSGLAALAGIMLVSRLNAGTPTVADGWELDVIAAVIIGGTSLFGGAGSVLGTLLGAIFMTTLKTGMVLLGVSPYSQGVVSGVVILVAVLSGSLRFPKSWTQIGKRPQGSEQPAKQAESKASG